MTYAVKQDLVDRFGSEELVQLTDRTNLPASTIDDTVVAKALADADRTIDGYLAATDIALPLAQVPELVQTWACAIARYFLHANAPTETVRKNYEDALRALRDVAAGRIKLQVAGAPADTSDDVQISTPGDRIFTRDTLQGY
jgi:phage gp36-like protein